MRRLAIIALITVVAGMCAANELETYAVWVTGHVINDAKEGLMFRADKAIQGNTTDNLVYLAVTEDLAKTFAPMCYQGCREAHATTVVRRISPTFRRERSKAPKRQL